MTHQPLTKAEREELLRLLKLSEPSDWHPTFDDESRFNAKARILIPRLLDDLDAAEAQRDRAESELDAERRMRVEAEAARDDARGELDDISSESGYAVSFDEEGNGDDRTLPEFVRDLAAERDALAAQLDEREGDMHARIRAGYDATVADSWRAKVAEVETERDALKAKLAASDCRDVASDDRPRICTDDKPCGRHLLAAQCFDARQAWSQERTEVIALNAKLAALADAAQPFASDLGCDAVHHAVKDRHDQRESCPVVARLRAAIAAARGGAS